MQDIKQMVEEALAEAFQVEIERDFPDAEVVPSSFHYEEKAKDLTGLLQPLIKELTEREGRLTAILQGVVDWDDLNDEDFEGQLEEKRYSEIANLMKLAKKELGIKEN